MIYIISISISIVLPIQCYQFNLPLTTLLSRLLRRYLVKLRLYQIGSQSICIWFIFVQLISCPSLPMELFIPGRPALLFFTTPISLYMLLFPPSDNLSPLLSRLVLNPAFPLTPALTTLAYQDLSHLWRPTAVLSGTTLMRCLRSRTMSYSCMQGKTCSPSSSPRPQPLHIVWPCGAHRTKQYMSVTNLWDGVGLVLSSLV